MKLSISLLLSLLSHSSHFNLAEGGTNKAAAEKGKRVAAEKGKNVAMKTKKDAETGTSSHLLRRDGKSKDASNLDDAEGDYIVVFKKNKIKNEKTEADFLTKKAKGKLKKTYSKALPGFSARLTRKAMNELQSNPDVDYIEEDVQVTINDCTAVTQSSVPSWGLDRIDFAVTTLFTSELDGTYSYVEDGPAQEVHVYVIDTGINHLHDEFVARPLGECFGAVDNDSGSSGSCEDCHGHGTHVAGTIGGKQYGVAKNANIVLHAVRAFNCAGSGRMSDILEAYDWVIDQCANKTCVANGSFGSSFSQSSNNGAASLVDAGVVYAVAAGNSNVDACGKSPASAQGVITVGATTQTDVRSGYSCYGECVEIFAPVRTQVDIFCPEIGSILFLKAPNIISSWYTIQGSAITSAWIGGNSSTNTISGTSMASPHVAGVAALIRQLDPTLTPAEVTRVIEMQALSDVITDVGLGSPNLLLQVPSLTCELPLLPPPTTIHTFHLDLTTDSYAFETSWDLKDPLARIVATGSGYENVSSYEEIFYIDGAGEYTFTIYDSYGDGICCSHGDGFYSLKVNDDPVMLENGGLFNFSQSTTFGNAASVSPSLELSPSPSSSSPPSIPSVVPSFSPSVEPSISALPSSPPSSLSPSISPSSKPSKMPSLSPSIEPSTPVLPRSHPYVSPTSSAPSNMPSPSSSDTPSISPSSKPSRMPSLSPSVEPSTSVLPSSHPYVSPTSSARPSNTPGPSSSDTPSTVLSSAASVPPDPPEHLPTAPSSTEMLSNDDFLKNEWGNFKDEGKNNGFMHSGQSHNNASWFLLLLLLLLFLLLF